MQNIHAGEIVIPAYTIYKETRMINDLARDVLRIIFPEGYIPTEEDIQALSENEWRLYNSLGALEGTYHNYNEMLSVEANFAKVTDLTLEIDRLTGVTEQLEAVVNEKESAISSLSNEKEVLSTKIATVQSVTNQLLYGRQDDLLIVLLDLMEEWQLLDKNEDPISYLVGDVRKYQGHPYTCIVAHSTEGDENRSPINAPTLWIVYHSQSEEYALPWVDPTGAHDIYREGEYVLWNDIVYLCLTDTDRDPDVLPDYWKKIVEMEEDENEEPEEDDGDGEDPEEPENEEYPAWVQPTGGHDSYSIGDKVSHNDKKWVSTANANTWEPGVYGWELEVV